MYEGRRGDERIAAIGPRICHADVALIEARAVASIRANERLADGRVLVCERPILLARATNARRYIFDRIAKPFTGGYPGARHIIAAEIGRELDARTVAQRLPIAWG